MILRLIKNQKKEEYLRSIFFDLIKQNQGLITALDLAMAAKISGTEAKIYLDKFAREFDTHFEVTDEGHIVYKFPCKKNNIGINTSTKPQDKETIQTKSSQKTQINNSPSFDNTTKSNSSNPNNLQKDVKNKTVEEQKQEKSLNLDFDRNFKDINKEIKNISKSLNDLFGKNKNF
jgi:hypothetical protein